MKTSTQILALMAALAVGTAGAQSVSRTDNMTNAGTTITNQATASYQDPTAPASTLTSASNTVTTTVLPKNGFNLTYPSGLDTATTNTPAGAPATHQLTNVVPGTNVVFPYAAVNNGNATETITLSTNNTSGVTNVQYFLSNPDTNGDGKVSAAELTAAGAGVTSITVAPQGDDPSTVAVETNTGIVSFWQVYTANGAPGTVVGATPVGTGQAWNGTANVSTTETASTLFWQYNSSTIVSPSVTTGPNGTPAPGGVNPPPAGGTTVPGYTDPSGTVIAISGSEQIAYPKADTNTTPDTVVFTNTVSNGTAIPDTVTLSIVPRTNQAGYSQTVTPTGTPGVYTVVQTNPDGTTTTATVTLGTTSTTLAANGSASYTVTVTYPDQDSLTNPSPIYVAVGVDSGNDSDSLPDSTAYDTILPPAMLFADSTAALGGTDTAVQQSGTASSTVSFPMDVANTGEYPDTYNLSGYTVITKLDGTKQIVGLTYSGGGAAATGTTAPVAVDLNGDGDTLDAGETTTVPVYVTGTVAANTETTVSANVALPSDTAATNGTPFIVKQTATAVYSTQTKSDLNDQIVVNSVGSLAVGKFTEKAGTAANSDYVLRVGGVATAFNGTSANPAAIANPAGYSAFNSTSYVPGQNYSYKIIAKNTYNSRVESFYLSDSLNINLSFVSLQGAVTGNTVSGAGDTSGTTVIYSTDGTTWSSSAPSTGTSLYVAVDDPTQAGSQPGSLDPNAWLDMTITVKIK